MDPLFLFPLLGAGPTAVARFSGSGHFSFDSLRVDIEKNFISLSICEASKFPKWLNTIQTRQPGVRNNWSQP